MTGIRAAYQRLCDSVVDARVELHRAFRIGVESGTRYPAFEGYVAQMRDRSP